MIFLIRYGQPVTRNTRYCFRVYIDHLPGIAVDMRGVV